MKKYIIRFFWIFFGVQILPLDPAFYNELLGFNWQSTGFYTLFRIAQYYPQAPGPGYFGAILWSVAVAAIGTTIWSIIDKGKIPTEILYYWLRVLLRYRLAIAVIGYGLIKFFPLQMPYPSLSNLHTNYGDYYPWKVYYHTLGITPGYESFLGAVEVLAGVMLLFRKTTTIGAGILLGFIGNVFAANIAYDAGDAGYSSFLFSIALFLFAYDAPRLFSLLVQGRFTKAAKPQPQVGIKQLQLIRNVGKVATAAFILVLAVSTYANYTTAPFKYPSTPGIAGTEGFYNVREFRFNDSLLPYSTTDSNRWQNVVFEKWATISIRIARPVRIDNSMGNKYYANDIDRNFESAGVGGRHYYSYEADTMFHTMLLTNKNKNHPGEFYNLKFSRSGDSTIVAKGVDEKNNVIHAVLERLPRKYMIKEGRRKTVKL